MKRKRKQQMAEVLPEGDLIERAFRREREHSHIPAVPLEWAWVWDRAFRCVCCGHARRDEDRQDLSSEVCLYCVVRAEGSS